MGETHVPTFWTVYLERVVELPDKCKARVRGICGGDVLHDFALFGFKAFCAAERAKDFEGHIAWGEGP